MTSKQAGVEHFIRLIRGISSQYLRYACTRGACHRFYCVLKDRFPSAEPYRVGLNGGGHVVAKIYGEFWDIWGLHDEKEDGRATKLRPKALERFASCYFDEAFVLQNIYQVMNEDKREEK